MAKTTTKTSDMVHPNTVKSSNTGHPYSVNVMIGGGKKKDVKWYWEARA